MSKQHPPERKIDLGQSPEDILNSPVVQGETIHFDGRETAVIPDGYGKGLVDIRDHLVAVLRAIRVRAIPGWKKDRCIVCDRPHSTLRPCNCPHHAAIAYLKSQGVEIDDA